MKSLRESLRESQTIEFKQSWKDEYLRLYIMFPQKR